MLTTCASDYMTWRNVLPPGVSDCNGVRVRRFSVDHPRNIAKFNEFSRRVFGGEVSREDEEQWMRMQGPHSSALLEYLRNEKSGYDAFVFFTYLYATTYFGLPLVKEKALLIPTVHDEPPVYLSIFDSLFQKAGRLLFLTPEEQEFVYRRFALPGDRGEVVGVGIQDLAPAEELPDALRNRIDGQPYVLYLGRVDPSKGCGVLVDYFQRFRRRNPSLRLRLVLAGKAAMKIAEDENIVATGYLPERAKTRCIDDALCMVTPSPYESLCLAALEAWARGKPVLANAECRVLVGQCRRSGGGLWYGTYPEFEECLRALAGNQSLRGRMGASGAEFVARSYGWAHAGEHYWRNIKSVAGE